jgi:membrane protein implicated in regulation of membrane protease activity
MSTALAIAAGIIVGIAGDQMAARRPQFALWWFGTWTVLCTVMSALLAAQHHWRVAALLAGCAAINAFAWWKHWNRRKRKPAGALLGAKSRARIAALVTRQREAQVLR